MISPLLDYANRVLANSPTGLWMLDETSGTTAADISGHSHEQYAVTWTATLAGTPTVRSSNTSAGSQYEYLRIVKNSSSSWDFARSTDGTTWSTQLSAFNLGAVFTPDYIGFASYCGASGAFSNAMDFIRFT